MMKMIFPVAIAAACIIAGPATGAEGELRLEDISFKVIYDNTEPREGFRAEWGFSCLVEGCESTILFDTGGRGDVLLGNLAAAGVDPSDIDIVVLSHIHNDHTGGLGALLERNSDVKVYLPASFPEDFKREVDEGSAGVSEIDEATELIPGVWSTGDMEGPVREQALAISTGGGTIVITGCAHPGVDRIAEKASEITGRKLLCVMGGFHLHGAGRARLEEIAAVFDRCDVRFCGASHCTGDDSIGFFSSRYGDRYVKLGAGAVVNGDELAAR
jgi:7,8-dihydropterin-6-yl-methyl-4-(beta-D-ribofuranosyl)aminobenzene 5'-phosphate synthase